MLKIAVLGCITMADNLNSSIELNGVVTSINIFNGDTGLLSANDTNSGFEWSLTIDTPIQSTEGLDVPITASIIGGILRDVCSGMLNPLVSVTLPTVPDCLKSFEALLAYKPALKINTKSPLDTTKVTSYTLLLGAKAGITECDLLQYRTKKLEGIILQLEDKAHRAGQSHACGMTRAECDDIYLSIAQADQKYVAKSDDGTYSAEQCHTAFARRNNVYAKSETYNKNECDTFFVRQSDVFKICDKQYTQKEDVYTKAECYKYFSSKLDVYTKVECDKQYARKEDVYTQAECYDYYPSKSNVYTKAECDDRYVHRTVLCGIYSTLDNIKDSTQESRAYTKEECDEKFASASTQADILTALKAEISDKQKYLSAEQANEKYATKDDLLKMRGEIMTLLSTYAPLESVYTKNHIYTKTEADDLFARRFDVYTKGETYSVDQANATFATNQK